MQCGNCGHELTTGAGFCGNCGAQIAMPTQPPVYGVPPLPPVPQPPATSTPNSQPHQPPPPPPPPQPSPAAQQSYQQPPSAPGHQPYPYIQPVQLHPSSKYNELTIIAAVLLFFFPPVSLILGIIAVNQIKRSHERGRGLAIACIIVGAIVVVSFIVLIIALAATDPDFTSTES